MAASMAKRSVGALALALAVVTALVAMEGMAVDGSVSCGAVSSKLAPCALYLLGRSASPSGDCCGGVQGLYSLTKSSRPDRVTACGCIKSQSNSLGGSLNPANVASLPGKCGVNLGYTPSLSINCNGIP